MNGKFVSLIKLVKLGLWSSEYVNKVVAEAKTKNLTITASLQSKSDGNISLANGATTGQFILSHNSDTQVPAYKITTGYKPTYKDSASYPDETPILMNDFYSSTNTDSDSYKDWTSPFTYDTPYDRRGWWYLRNSTTSVRVGRKSPFRVRQN